MTQQEARELVRKHGGVRAAARALKMAPTTFKNRLDGIPEKAAPPKLTAAACASSWKVHSLSVPPAPPARRRKAGVSLTEFLGKHDASTRMRNLVGQARKRMEKGRIYADYELRRMVGCGDARLWRDTADELHADCQFRIGNDIHWADPDVVLHILEKTTKARPLHDSD